MQAGIEGSVQALGSRLGRGEPRTVPRGAIRLCETSRSAFCWSLPGKGLALSSLRVPKDPHPLSDSLIVPAEVDLEAWPKRRDRGRGSVKQGRRV